MASSIRKVSEDVKLRPFLSSHFDSQTYIKTVMKEGRSEECFNNVTTCIEEVNEEIKGYISQNKDVLMSGMQDVALLSERYSLLFSTSQKLQRNVDRLKKEALESYDLVKLRTVELERIHTTSMVLRQLRQFVHCRAQLEHLLKAAGEVGGIKGSGGTKSDIRHLASSAKTLYELEGVIAIPALLEIKYVSQHLSSIAEFGRQLRELAKEQLLTALIERNQASVAASLQVFFNLQSLPEIILLAIDSTIRTTIELSRTALDLNMLVAAHTDLVSTTGVTGVTNRSTVQAALVSAGSLSSLTLSQSQQKKTLNSAQNTAVSQQNLPNSSQVRAALKEIARDWGSIVSDQAMQIQVLQRVMAKKEDPSTHIKFTDVLESAEQSNSALGGNRLLELYWTRLQSSLCDVSSEKLKSQPFAAGRIYPFLRKVAVDSVLNLKLLTSRDLSRDAISISGYGSNNNANSYSTGGGENYNESIVQRATPWSDAGQVNGSGQISGVQGERAPSEGMFGSLVWSGTGGGSSGRGRRKGGNELLGCLGMGSRRSPRAMTATGGGDRKVHNENGSPRSSARDGTMRAAAQREHFSIAESEQDCIAQAEIGLVGGLRPLRDKYLAGALGRMTGPVLLMFPEMDGYTAAVPSKRDMQALIKVIQSELTMAAAEGDTQGGWLRAVSREAVKSIQLMVSKVEGMVLHTSDAHKINGSTPNTSSGSSGASTAVVRTSSQEHNGQLFNLLAQLRDALDKMPANVLIRNSSDSYNKSSSAASGSIGGGGGGNESIAHHHDDEIEESRMTSLLTQSLKGAITCIDLVISRQLLSPLLEAITTHLKSVLLPLLKEGASTNRTGMYAESSSGVDCSSQVQILVKLIPEILRIHLISMANCPPLASAVEELGLRVLHLYITVAALVRPVTEQARLRTARDMGALEAALAAAGISLGARESHPVIMEFRAFRRLLFMEDAADLSGSPRTNSEKSNLAPPSRMKLQSLPFFKDLRPSTVLGYLSSCGPSQLPSPYFSLSVPGSGSVLGSGSGSGSSDSGDGALQIYVDFLTSIQSYSNDSDNTQITSSLSVSFLYLNKTPLGPEGYEGESDWREIPGEVRAWEAVQGSLDVYVQRISVANPSQKSHMRAWYEALQDIGGLYHGNAQQVQ